MKEEFVTYEIAKELKELGFDEPCLARYPAVTVEYAIINELDPNNALLIGNGAIYDTKAPLWQQAISFILNILSKKDNFYLINCSFYSDNSESIRNGGDIEIPFDNLKECILILIELCKKN